METRKKVPNNEKNINAEVDEFTSLLDPKTKSNSNNESLVQPNNANNNVIISNTENVEIKSINTEGNLLDLHEEEKIDDSIKQVMADLNKIIQPSPFKTQDAMELSRQIV